MQDLIKRQDAIVISYNIIEKWAKDIMVEVIKKADAEETTKLHRLIRREMVNNNNDRD